MGEIRQELNAFIGSERERFANRHNNMFAFGFSQLIRYHEFLAIVVGRYKRASDVFVASTRELQSTMKRGTHEVSEEQQALHVECQNLTTSLHLEIESFYLFAKILLDKVARALEFYFGQARKLSLDSHDDLVKRLEKYASFKKLVLPDDFLKLARQLKADISDHRDYEIAHEKSPRTLHATAFDSEGVTKIASIKFSPTARDQQVETKPLDDLMMELGRYIEKMIELVTRNRDQTNLELKKPHEA